MSTHRRKVSPSELPTKSVRAPDGTVIRLKVVKADSANLGNELLAAFRSNVRGIRESRRRKTLDAPDAAQA
jgi:hypothetical protein